MAEYRRSVAILVKNRAIRLFLEKFFDNRKSFRPIFHADGKKFIEQLKKEAVSAVLVQSSLLPSVADRLTRYPSVALIAGNVKKGIDTAIDHNVDRYLYAPFHPNDLEYKLGSSIVARNDLMRMQEELKELGAIVDIMNVISDTLDPKEILFRVVSRIASTIPVTRCSMIRVDWLKRHAYVVSSHDDRNFKALRINLRKYPEILKALTTKNPVFVEDVAVDPLMEKVRKIIMPLGIRSILVLPVLLGEKVIGTLFLRMSRSDRTFTENEIRLLNSLASASARSLHNAFLFEQMEDEKTRLEKLAITDYLTGIYNIRYFYHRIIEEFSRSLRYGHHLSCLMLDIDYFKKINDRFGHATGDQVLKEFAQFLRKQTRKSDVLARYGGEEFILLLPHTTLEGACVEGERLCSSVRNYRFKSLKGKASVTISIGIASYPNGKVSTHDDLISIADDMLFRAKESGRNRIMASES